MSFIELNLIWILPRQTYSQRGSLCFPFFGAVCLFIPKREILELELELEFKCQTAIQLENGT
jgi:hypothetical protein